MYEQILLPVVDRVESNQMIEHLRKITGDQTVTVHLLHVFDLFADAAMGRARNEVVKERKEKLNGLLEDLSDALSEEGYTVHTAVEETDANAGECIVTYARDHDIDLIIMGTHGRSGVSRWFLGSTTERVLRASRHIPTLVVPLEND